MPSLDQHSSTEFVKGLYMGNPGSGKTGSLISLAQAGYDLRIYDFDNLLGSLFQYVQKDAPECMPRIQFQTFTDKMKGIDNPLLMNGGSYKVLPFVTGIPDAFVRALKQLNHWKEVDPVTKAVVTDFGPAADFGPKVIVVIDSLTSMALAAFRYAQAMNPAAKEVQATYFAAQQMVINMIALLASEGFKANVLVLAHIDYDKNQAGLTKGFPRSIGSALNTQIGAYFNCVLMAEDSGNGKRVIRTNSTGIVDLKNPVSFKVADTLPLESGLATFFQAVRPN